MRKSEIDAEKKPELEGPEFWVKETSQEEETQQNQQVEKQDRQGEIEENRIIPDPYKKERTGDLRTK